MFLYDDMTLKWEYEDNKYCLHIQYDEAAPNPRIDYDNQDIMACFHRRYKLGDEIGTNDPEVFWRNLVRDNITNEETVEAIRTGKLEGLGIQEHLSISNPCVSVIELDDGEEEFVAYSHINEDEVLSYILDDLTIKNCMDLMNEHAEWLHLYLYEHGGLTISASAGNPFGDPWDSGCVGWIVALKENMPVRAYWRQDAIEMMVQDTDEYDQYLRGETYGYTLYQILDGEWEEVDSCWGFIGDDIMKNGMVECVGFGLWDAIHDSSVEEGEARKQTVVGYMF